MRPTSRDGYARGRCRSCHSGLTHPVLEHSGGSSTRLPHASDRVGSATRPSRLERNNLADQIRADGQKGRDSSPGTLTMSSPPTPATSVPKYRLTKSHEAFV